MSVFEIYASSETGPWLPEISCPCLVLTAEFDGGSNPRLNRFIDEQLPDSELVILPHLRHDILNEASEQVEELTIEIKSHHDIVTLVVTSVDRSALPLSQCLFQ